MKQSELVAAIVATGYMSLQASDTLRLLGQHEPPDDWNLLVESFNHLEVDSYMADRGRYRRRRHATFLIEGEKIERQPHRPHYQSLDYNALNGGIERWYTPIEPAIANGSTVTSLLAWCTRTFNAVRGKPEPWHVEMHQFRIEASGTTQGQPTPEGMHRDGVDYVLVLLVARHNVSSGTTTIGDASGRAHGSFTLIHPFDAMMLDDHRVYHGVTAIKPVDGAKEGYRDVLVVTFRIASGCTS